MLDISGKFPNSVKSSIQTLMCSKSFSAFQHSLLDFLATPESAYQLFLSSYIENLKFLSYLLSSCFITFLENCTEMWTSSLCWDCSPFFLSLRLLSRLILQPFLYLSVSFIRVRQLLVLWVDFLPCNR